MKGVAYKGMQSSLAWSLWGKWTRSVLSVPACLRLWFSAGASRKQCAPLRLAAGRHLCLLWCQWWPLWGHPYPAAAPSGMPPCRRTHQPARSLTPRLGVASHFIRLCISDMWQMLCSGRQANNICQVSIHCLNTRFPEVSMRYPKIQYQDLISMEAAQQIARLSSLYVWETDRLLTNFSLKSVSFCLRVSPSWAS